MTRIFTPPDYESNRSIPKVYIFNCPWTDEELSLLVDNLDQGEYDIYIYDNDRNDVQWAEGIRTNATKIYNWAHYKDTKPEDLLKIIHDVFKDSE